MNSSFKREEEQEKDTEQEGISNMEDSSMSWKPGEERILIIHSACEFVCVHVRVHARVHKVNGG